jgi:hypothetical protein
MRNAMAKKGLFCQEHFTTGYGCREVVKLFRFLLPLYIMGEGE